MSTSESPRPPLPPFDAQTAAQKVRMAGDAWNTRERGRVALARNTWGDAILAVFATPNEAARAALAL